jgi:N-acyl-D-amino-acid deacylase
MMTGAFFAGMSEDNMRRILSEPYVMPGSDASLRALSGPLSRDYPHPRAYGTMPRFLRMVIDEDMMPLSEAIRKMTSLPAEQFRLDKRGEIKAGYAADVVVFDADELKDNATYAAPHAFASGVRHVLVNGESALSDGKRSGCLGGRIL